MFEGMDPELVRQGEAGLRAQARVLDQTVQSVDALIRHMHEVWQGPQADEFQGWWQNKHRAELVSAAAAIHQGSAALGQQVQQQDDASSGGSRTGGGAGAAGGTSLLDSLGTLGIDAAGTAVDGLLGMKGFFDASTVADAAVNIAGFAAFYKSGAGSLVGQFSAFAKADSFASEVTDTIDGKNWESLLKAGMTDAQAGGALGKGAEILGKAGKVLGPVGVVTGVLGVGDDISRGDYGHAAYDTVATGVGALALVTPPPADVALGITAGVMTAGEYLYDHPQVVKNVENFVGSAASGAANLVEGGLGAIGDGIGSLFG